MNSFYPENNRSEPTNPDRRPPEDFRSYHPQDRRYGPYRPTRPDRYTLALTGFIIAIAANLAIVMTIVLLVISSDNDSGGAAVLGLLMIPLSGIGSIAGLVLSIIAVRSSRGVGFAVAGICFSALAMLGSGLFSLLAMIGFLAVM